MFPILYEQITAGQVPQHNGLGVLSDVISCYSEQVRNDLYELTFEYPMSGIHASEIAERRIIKAKPNPTDDPQLYRIERVGKVMNGKFTVFCNHISYDLSGYLITSGTAGSAVEACTLLQSAASGYTITTDKTATGNFKITEPSSVRSWFAGKEGSFLDVFGTAELKYDNFNVQFKLHAGQDRGQKIIYGKNLLELSQELDCSNLCTAVMCYWKSSEGDVVSGQQVSTGITLDVPVVRAIDVSNEYDEAPTVETLTQRATNFIANNNVTTPKNNIKLNFAQSEELTGRVDLCDEVTIYYEALGISGKAKCIRTKYDCIREKYVETEFGDVQADLSDSFVAAVKEIQDKPSKSFLAESVDRATKLITGNLGGYVVMHDANGDGQPDEILIMDTADINTATKVWRWNKNGLGYSSEGYDGEYGLAMTADGEIVADFITTGVLNADLIKAGVIQDVAGNSTINMTNGVATLKNLIAKNSFRHVDSNGIERTLITYNVADGTSIIFKDADAKMIALLYAKPDNGGNLELRNTDGKITVFAFNRLDGYGGTVRVQDSNGYSLAGVTCEQGGGRVWAANKANKTGVAIDGYDAGGSIRINNPDGNGRINLFASHDDQTGAEGGNLYFFDENGTNRFYINNGDINMHNSAGNKIFRVYMGTGGTEDGTARVYDDGGNATITLSGQSGNVSCVSLTQTSSKKVKKNIKPIKDASKILELDAVSFDYKNEGRGKDKRGFIAEDVEKVLPNLVTPETEETPATLDYIGMIPYLQAVIKDQEQRIKALEEKLK